MNFILFTHKDALQKGARLQNAIENSDHGNKLQVYKTFNSFKSRLKVDFGDTRNEILILFAESRQRLNHLISLSDLMEGRRIVLILPDESKQTLSIASKFFPRFFTTVRDNYNDLCDVIDKMTDKNSNEYRVKY
ncbi:MAG: hypothetical protein GY857_16375 [Desulfobacula sp.]|nr:hypothetical protein [Desulfobacula sp.]